MRSLFKLALAALRHGWINLLVAVIAILAAVTIAEIMVNLFIRHVRIV
jgi:hypothetical protein